jgi:tRNA modification GTPase
VNPADTIVAISSATGAAARMIVRISGAQAFALAASVTSDELVAGVATRMRLRFVELTVPATLYAFRAPRSYTGDDLIEFHLPGNPLLSRLLLEHLIRAGARPAEPGEFTARAYFHGRLDLAEAEGVAATIAASNERELSAARQLLTGELSRRLKPPMDRLVETLALVEAGIDFADEGISFFDKGDLLRRVDGVDDALASLLSDSARFEPLTHEPVVVLIGRPNAGKSTLLNALAGRERAVVSPVAGTTRDALSAEVALPGGIVRLVDVAGLEPEVSAASISAVADVERQMSDRARQMAQASDVLLLVRDVTDARPPVPTPRKIDLVVLTKVDLISSAAAPDDAAVAVSAVTGAGLPVLRLALGRLCFGEASAGGSAMLALNARHVQHIQDGRRTLASARASAAAAEGPELIAHHLRAALDALGGVLGAVTPDDVLGHVFSAFCIGK